MKPLSERMHGEEYAFPAEWRVEVAQLEAENEKIAKAAERGIAKAWKRVEVLEAENERLNIDLSKPPQERLYCQGCELLALKGDDDGLA